MTGSPRKKWFQHGDEYLIEKETSLREVEILKTYKDRDKWSKLSHFTNWQDVSLTGVG